MPHIETRNANPLWLRHRLAWTARGGVAEAHLTDWCLRRVSSPIGHAAEGHGSPSVAADDD